jgi:hypothetical protein
VERLWRPEALAYAMLGPMPSPSNAAPPSFLLTSRARWLWLAVALVLGFWLLAQFVVGDGDPDERARPLQEGMPQPASGFASKADLFKQRQDVRPSRKSPTVPLRMDDGERK